MRQPRPYRHVFRVAVLFLFGLIAFMAVRSALIPADFGRYGFYRAGALDDVRARPIRYAGEASCRDCHEEPFEVRKGQGHQRVKCEACHGPVRERDVMRKEKDISMAACMDCHRARQASIACNYCHEQR